MDFLYSIVKKEPLQKYKQKAMELAAQQRSYICACLYQSIYTGVIIFDFWPIEVTTVEHNGTIYTLSNHKELENKAIDQNLKADCIITSIPINPTDFPKSDTDLDDLLEQYIVRSFQDISKVRNESFRANLVVTSTLSWGPFIWFFDAYNNNIIPSKYDEF